jgi:hypothetical protein
MDSQDKPQLPPLHSGLLDFSQVEHLLADIQACADQIEVLPKYAAQQHVAEAGRVTLDHARELLASRAVHGLQIRYRYDGADWWDTLMVAGDQFRIVRIRHEFDDLS